MNDAQSESEGDEDDEYDITNNGLNLFKPSLTVGSQFIEILPENELVFKMN